MHLGLLLACSVPPVGWDSDSPGPAPTVDLLHLIEGRVVDAQGPVQGAQVQTDPYGYLASTDAEGRFVLEFLPAGAYSLVTAATGHATTRLAVELDADLVDVEVLLPAEAPVDGSVRVLVLGPRGLPWPGATVQSSDGGQGLSDDEGVALLTGLGGQQVDLSVQAEGLWPYDVSALQVPERGARQLTVTLGGRPSEQASTVGSRYCVACHYETVATWRDSRHARALSSELTDPLQDLFEQGAELAVGGGSALLWMQGSSPMVTLVGASTESRDLTVRSHLGGQGSVLLTEVDGLWWPLPVAWRAADPERGPDGEPGLLAWEPERWFADGELLEEPAGPDAEQGCLGCHATAYEPQGLLREGVGCEACHGPGSSHIAAPDPQRARFITQPQDLDDERANAVCAQCHGADSPEFWASGNASAPGQQADELPWSGHGGDPTLRCFDCHDPHGGVEHSLRLESKEDSLCLACHDSPEHGHEQRCTSCHMPATAARLGFGEQTGAGDLSSHLFVAVEPQQTVDHFDALGQSTLSPGEYPVHACMECHERLAQEAPETKGPAGDPSLRSTHEAYQQSWQELYP